MTPEPAVPDTPTCRKLAAARAKRATIVDFIEWLHENRGRYDVLALDPEITTLDFLGIDRQKLEEERRALLDYQRACNERSSEHDVQDSNVDPVPSD
jgi:erythromycin esterase-like protein